MASTRDGPIQRQPAGGDPLYDSVRQAARRLTIGVPLLLRLIDSGAIPTRTLNGRRKIAKLVVGQLLASAYDVWPQERRPHYSVEDLRRLNGIRVEEVASLLGLGRTSGYEAARKGQIPARKLPNSDRWVIPEDVVTQMEAYDIGILPAAQSGEGRPRPTLQHGEVDELTTVVETLRQEAPNLPAKPERPRWRYLTVPELARRLGVNNKQIYYAVARGTLSCHRFGRKIVFHPDVIELASARP